MDLSTLLPMISPLVAAAVAYLRGEAAQKAGEKAAEAIGTKVGEAVARDGSRVLATIRGFFTKHADPKAQRALADFEQDPDDADYQQKLVKETARLANDDPVFAQELKVLAEQVTIAQPHSVVQHIDNQAPNHGAQGVFNAPVAFGQPAHNNE